MADTAQQRNTACMAKYGSYLDVIGTVQGVRDLEALRIAAGEPSSRPTGRAARGEHRTPVGREKVRAEWPESRRRYSDSAGRTSRKGLTRSAIRTGPIGSGPGGGRATAIGRRCRRSECRPALLSLRTSAYLFRHLLRRTFRVEGRIYGRIVAAEQREKT
jgi:hypothetical protein